MIKKYVLELIWYFEQLNWGVVRSGQESPADHVCADALVKVVVEIKGE